MHLHTEWHTAIWKKFPVRIFAFAGADGIGFRLAIRITEEVLQYAIVDISAARDSQKTSLGNAATIEMQAMILYRRKMRDSVSYETNDLHYSQAAAAANIAELRA